MLLSAISCQVTDNPDETVNQAIYANLSPDTLMQQAVRAKGRKASLIRIIAAQKYLELQLYTNAIDALATVDREVLSQKELANYWLLQSSLTATQGRIPESERLMLKAISTGLVEWPIIRQHSQKICTLKYTRDIEQITCQLENLKKYIPTIRENQRFSDEAWKIVRNSSALDVGFFLSEAPSKTLKWWSLRDIALSSLSRTEEKIRMMNWLEIHAKHADRPLLPTQLQRRISQPYKENIIGLILPLSGIYADAANAVRDGFIAAYIQSNEINKSELLTSPPILIYDSEKMTLPAIIQDAETNNVDILIGPLLKNNVNKLNALQLPLPFLTLNYIDSDQVVSAAIYQLGLAIEDEADGLLGKLAQDKVERILIIKNRSDWANRSANQIEKHWKGHQTLRSFSDITQITKSVGEAMGVEASISRKNTIAQKLDVDLEFLPRARQDIDAVVALVDIVEAQALKPALDFHFAEHIPIYTTSQTVRAATTEQLKSLNGFIVSESPWLIEPDTLHEKMDKAFGLDLNPLTPLYALGIDAYRLSNRLDLLYSKDIRELLGSVGVLTMEENKKISRRLAWGRVRGGSIEKITGK